MKNYIEEGNTITRAHTSAVVSGQAVLFGKILGVAVTDAEANAENVYNAKGCYTLPAKSADAMPFGTELYWDNTAKELTITATANTLVGYAWSDKVATETEVVLKLK